MSIILDPNKSLVNINVIFIEETKPYGNSVFRFIRTKEEYDELRATGYLTREEYVSRSQQAPGGKADGLDPKKVIDKISTRWKMLSWAEQNSIYSKCMKEDIGPDGKTNPRFDGISFRDLKLKTCLKSWDLKDETGRPIALTSVMIDNLDPDFAQELINTFEKVTEPEAEEDQEANQ